VSALLRSRGVVIALLVLAFPGKRVGAEKSPPDWVSSLAKYAYTESSGEALESVTLVETGERFIPLDAVQYGFSPDEKGVFLRTAGEDRDQQLLWVGSKGEQRPRLLMNARWGIAWPTWSPDGDRIALILQHFDRLGIERPVTPEEDVLGFSLAVVELPGGATREASPRWYYASKIPEHIDWSPDGQSIAFTASFVPMSDERNTQELYLVNLSSPEPEIRQLTDNDVADYGPVFSPDGSRLAFERIDWRSPVWQVVIIDLATAAETVVAGGERESQKGKLFASNPDWSSDGSRLLFKGRWSRGPAPRSRRYTYDPAAGITEIPQETE
jgi:Tol biopolymer transport system component